MDDFTPGLEGAIEQIEDNAVEQQIQFNEARIDALKREITLASKFRYVDREFVFACERQINRINIANYQLHERLNNKKDHRPICFCVFYGSRTLNEVYNWIYAILSSTTGDVVAEDFHSAIDLASDEDAMRVAQTYVDLETIVVTVL